MSISAEEALAHLISCPNCRITPYDSTICTLCGRSYKYGYVLISRCPEMKQVRVKSTGDVINWGACNDCIKENGITFHDGHFITITDKIKSAVETFKKRISYETKD